MKPEKSGIKSHRALELLDILRRLGGSARTSHLAAALDVSEETVRRTVKKLGKEGLVTRVHGGVFLAGDDTRGGLTTRLGQNRSEKREMARAVAGIVPDGAALFMDVSSTTTYVAEALGSRSGLQIITNSLVVAETLAGRNGNKVFLAGGEVAADLAGCFGSAVQEFVCRFHADFAILGADAVDPQRGFLLQDFSEAQLARCFVSHARQRIMVADRTKMGRKASVLLSAPDEIDIFVTDQPLDPVATQAMNAWGVEVVLPQLSKDR